MAGAGKMAHNEVAPSIDSIISQLVENNFYEYGKIINKFSSVEVPKGANEVKFNCLDELEHEEQTFPLTTPGPLGGPEAITCQQLVITQDILKIDRKCVMAVAYDPCDLYQSVLDWENIYAEKVRQTLVRGVELAIITEAFANVDAANIITPVTAGTLTETDLLCMLTALRKKNIPETDLCFLVNPEDYKNISVLPCFLKADASGSRQVLQTGALGSVFGSPVIWDNAIPAGEILLTHRDHLRVGRQAGVSILRADVPKKGCKEMSWTVKFGLKTIKGGCRAAKLTL